MSLRILQSSDWHLGAPVLPSGSVFGEDLVRLREQEERQVLKKIVDLVREKSIELVLLPGDLWDQEAIDLKVVRTIMETLGSLAPVPVIIVPGNHDFLSSGSPYQPDVVSRGALAWPDNVIIVRNHSFEQFYMPDRSDVSFTAMATGVNVAETNRLLQQELPRSAASINLLLFHGSREYRDGGYGGKQLVTAPFTDEELLAQDFTYTALGHYHSHSVIKDNNDMIRGAYAGSPFSRSFKEKGAKGVLILEVEEEGVVSDSFEFVRLDERKYGDISVNLTGSDKDEVTEERVRNALKQSEYSRKDIVRIYLEGAYKTGAQWRPEYDLSELLEGWEIRTNRLRAAFNLDEAITQNASGGAQAVFLNRIKQQIADEESHPEPDAEKLKQLQLMAMMGFEAFMGRAPQIHINPDVVDDAGEM